MNATPPPAKRIAAIVCTYNRHDVLPDVLNSLGKQSLRHEDYEVIVVDNSADRARQQAFWRRSKNRFDIALKIQSEAGLSKARNTGLRMANAPIVAFCDDDAVASPGWLEALVGLFEEEPMVGIGGGPVTPIWPDAPPAWLHPWLLGFFTVVDRGAVRRTLGDGEWLAGTNMAFRRELLLKVGGFEENLGRRGTLLLSNEELDVTQRIQQLGFHAMYEPAALVHHKVHAARMNQAWLRRRVAWQVISDIFRDGEAQEQKPIRHWDTIADYVLRMPPELRSIRGLFVDTPEPGMLHKQCDAIAALLQLMLADGQDPEAKPR